MLKYSAAAAISLFHEAAAAMPLSPQVCRVIKEDVKVIQLDEYQLNNLATSFLKELYIEFDFEAAYRELTLAEEVISDYFFLNKFKDES